MLGHHRPASETFHWQANSVLLIVVFGSYLPSSTTKNRIPRIGCVAWPNRSQTRQNCQIYIAEEGLFVGPTGVNLFDFFCSGIQFYLLLSPYLCFISLLYLDLYVLGDDVLICYGSFMQTKHLCVLIHN